MIKLEQILYVKTVAMYGSISKAAEKLFLSQPYLSAVIKDIEEELQVSLFLRHNKGVSLTISGEQFLLFAQEIEKNIEQIYQLKYSTTKPYCKFKIASIASLVLLDFFKKFENANAQLQIEFSYMETSNKNIIEQVVSGQVDLGIIYLTNYHRSQLIRQMKRDNIMFQSLYEENAHIMLRREHPLLQQKEVFLEDCLSFPFVCESYAVDFYRDYFEHNYPRYVFAPVIFEQSRSMLNYLTLENGFTFVISTLNKTSPFFESHLLEMIPLRDLDLTVSIGCITKNLSDIPDILKAYIAHLRQSFLEIENMQA